MNLLIVTLLVNSQAIEQQVCLALGIFNETFCIPEDIFKQLTNSMDTLKETGKIRKGRRNLRRPEENQLELIKSLINQLALREDRRTLTRNTWVEEGPGTFKSEPVEYHEDYLAASTKKLLAIKQAKDRAKKAKLLHA